MYPDEGERLTLRDVRFGYPRRPEFLGPISLAVRAGEFWAVVGPNGAGKSTLLRLMAGLTVPLSGEITQRGESLIRLSPRRRARSIAFVPQRTPCDLDATVRDVVLMGRFPHRLLGLFESALDHRIAEQAMATTQTLPFVDRALSTLSGGEAQRVHLAAAIAQEPRLLLLDEPTASLDIEHQLAIFSILQDRTRVDGLSVVVVTHDVNLAARFCTHVLLLNDGKAAAMGPPDAVVTPAVLEPVYGVRLASVEVPGEVGANWIVPISGIASRTP